LGMRMLGTDPQQQNMPPIWQLPPRERNGHRGEASGFLSQFSAIARLVGSQVTAVPAVVSALIKTVQHARQNPELAHVFTAPLCKLWRRVTASGRFSAQSCPLARLKAQANELDGTVNDVILAMCGSALRAYLRYHNELPDKPLVAMVPMSLRKDDSVGGNQVAVILANLATHVNDPLTRFRVIQN